MPSFTVKQMGVSVNRRALGHSHDKQGGILLDLSADNGVNLTFAFVE